MSNINTLKSIKDKKDKNSNCSDDECDQHQQQPFYAGGSDTSGQQILGPPSKKKNRENLIDDIFRTAFNAGARVVDSNSELPKIKSGRFPGSGFRLDSSPGQSTAKISNTKNENNKEKLVVHKLRMWKNGFSVDDGELRSYDDLTNAEFLECVKRGEIPRELLKDAQPSEVSLHIEDYRGIAKEKESVSQIKPFSGEGFRLGNVTADFTVNEESGSQKNEKENEENANKNLNTVLTEPTTKIQVRLADGTKLTLIMNLTHTVNDIRLYIVNSRPNYAASPFILTTSFPFKELSDESLTIEEARLQGTVVIQKFI